MMLINNRHRVNFVKKDMVKKPFPKKQMITICTILLLTLGVFAENNYRRYILANQDNPTSTFEEVSHLVNGRFKYYQYLTGIESKAKTGAVEIVVPAGDLFEPGKANLRADAKKEIRELVDAVSNRLSGHRVSIEGHTDDEPIRRNRNEYFSNWELSSARASALVREFENRGYPKDHLGAVGYGASRPIVPNRDRAGNIIRTNRMKNRRLVIRVEK